MKKSSNDMLLLLRERKVPDDLAKLIVDIDYFFKPNGDLNFSLLSSRVGNR